MGGFPDITGFTLDEAIKRCKKLGFEVDIFITRPDKEVSGGKLRVVRFKVVSEKKGVLTVVFENTKKGGKSKDGIQNN